MVKLLGKKWASPCYVNILKINNQIPENYTIILHRSGVPFDKMAKFTTQFDPNIIAIERGLTSRMVIIMIGSMNPAKAHWIKKADWSHIQNICKVAKIPLLKTMTYYPEKYICLATDNISGHYIANMAQYEKMIKYSVEAIRKHFPNKPIKVRLHPKCRTPRLAKYIQAIFTKYKITQDDPTVPPQDFVNQVGLLVIYHSSLGIEMLCRGLPIFMIKPLPDSKYTEVAYNLSQHDKIIESEFMTRRENFLKKYMGHMYLEEEFKTKPVIQELIQEHYTQSSTKPQNP